MLKKYKTVFMGTPDFSIPSLNLLYNHPLIDLSCVITMPDRKAGRGQNLKSPPVADYTKKNNIKLIQTENINKEIKLINKLKEEKIDLFIVIAFAQFLKTDLLNLPLIGCFNIHTSLLPKYRGAAPIQYTLMNGDSKTGVTIQKMVKKMDAGDIVLQDEITLSDDETGGKLFERLKNQAALTLDRFIKNINENNLTYTPQDESLVSFAPTLKKSDGFLDFESLGAEKIYNLVRALIPWPSTYCFINKKRVKILKATYEKIFLKPGELNIKNGTLVVGCKDNKAIRLKQIQIEGKKECSDIQYLMGQKNRKEEILINPKES